MADEIILSIISIIGIGGILSAFFTYLWQKKKELFLRENELKKTRYLSILLQMYTLINPTQLEKLKPIRPDIKSMDDLKEELKTEWVNTLIYSSDGTITTFKNFISNPNEKSFIQTVLSMRKELWGKKSKLTFTSLAIDLKQIINKE